MWSPRRRRRTPDDVVEWAARDLRRISRQLRRPRPVDAPALSDALRLIADRLDAR
jgi:hypothetical protein